MTNLIKTNWSAELEFALETSRRAGCIARDYFGRHLEVECKSDGSPVTEADKKMERSIREALEQRYPGDGILGEEEPEKASSSSALDFDCSRRWIIDPIDGTFNFTRGIDIFSILIALEVDNELVLGVVHNPVRDETYWAARGSGAFKNGSLLKVSTVSRLEDSFICFGAPDRIRKTGYWPALESAIDRTYRQRGFGDYQGFALVFEGKAEAHLETGVKSWDLAPMKVIVEEAGGVFYDLAGSDSYKTGNCLVTNKLLALDFQSIFSMGSS